jgi:hypothetical protein
MIKIRISHKVESQYDVVDYLVKQIPVIIHPVEDITKPSTDKAITKIIELDLPSDEMTKAFAFLGFLGWESDVIKSEDKWRIVNDNFHSLADRFCSHFNVESVGLGWDGMNATFVKTDECTRTISINRLYKLSQDDLFLTIVSEFH